MNTSTTPGLTVLHTLLLDALGRTTLLLLCAWIITRCFRRMSAARQHFLWLFALVGVIYVTGVSLALPICCAFGLTAVPATLPIQVWHSPTIKRLEVTQTALQQINAGGSSPTYTVAPLTSTLMQHNINFYKGGMALSCMAALWLSGTLLTLLRFARHRRFVQLLQQRSRTLESSSIQAILLQVAARLDVTYLPILLMLEAGNGTFSPLTWGWQRTFLLLPADVETWQRERIEAVLLHELAHIQRKDWVTQRIADIVCALYWFHPLVWIAARNLRASAERACDDMALTHGIAPDSYARQLLDIAQTLRARPLAPKSTLPFLRGSQLETRLRAVLDGTMSRRAFSRTWQGVILAVGALSLMPFALALPVATQNVKYVDTNIITAVNSKALLPGGVTVELIGIADTPDPKAQEPARWWQFDGAIIAAPYSYNNIVRGVDTDADHREQRIFGIRISGSMDENSDDVRELLLDNQSKPGQRETLSSFAESYENHLKTRNSNRYTLTRTSYFGSAHLPEHGTFRYGIALGDWHDLAIADPALKTIRVTVSDARVRFKKAINKGFIMKLPGGKQTTGLTLETQDNQGRVARRLVALTRQGKTVKIGSMFFGPEGAMTSYTCLIPPDLALNDVREFRLQTRPYTWAEFPDVALRPRK